MAQSPWCPTCGKRVEWHVTRAGRKFPIDPDPVPHGRFVFGPGLKLETAPPTTPLSKRRYMCHWDTSPGCKRERSEDIDPADPDEDRYDRED